MGRIFWGLRWSPVVVAVLLAGCVSTPPRHQENICHVFDEKDGWYKKAKKASKRWGSPIPVIMAIMHQESRFVAKAKPPRTKILWIFPGPRPSSAYGYSQAKDMTWDEYKDKSGNGWASRADFGDAADFIAWYNHNARRRANIRPDDAYHLYLAYHEGIGGFNRRTFRNKGWLKKVAHDVSARASRYRGQLAGCEDRLDSSWWWPF